MNEPSTVNYWIVVDTVSAPYAQELLSADFPISWIQPLFKNSDFDYLIDQSPLVINLGSSNPAQQIYSNYPALADCSVIFKIADDIDESDFIQHLQSLLTTTINQHKVLLRYYTNALWLKVGEELSEQHLHTLLGKAEQLIWADNQSNLYHRDNTSPLSWPSLYQLNSPIFNAWL